MVPPLDLTPTRGCICASLRRASRAVTDHYEQRFRGSGLRGTQFTVLSTLAQTGPIALSRLAEMLGVDRTTLSRNVRPLERRALIKLSGTKDARVTEASITPRGRALVRETFPRWQDAQASALVVLRRFGLSVTTADALRAEIQEGVET
jgi:DNA-binding MarR family transcriptional regulator